MAEFSTTPRVPSPPPPHSAGSLLFDSSVAAFIIEQRIKHCPRSSYSTAGGAANELYLVWHAADQGVPLEGRERQQKESVVPFDSSCAAILSKEFRTCANCYLIQEKGTEKEKKATGGSKIVGSSSSGGGEGGGGRSSSSSEIVISSSILLVGANSATESSLSSSSSSSGGVSPRIITETISVSLSNRLKGHVIVFNNCCGISSETKNEYICMELLLQYLEQKKTHLILINNFDDALFGWICNKITKGAAPFTVNRNSIPNDKNRQYQCGTVVLNRTYSRHGSSSQDKSRSRITSDDVGFNGQPSVKSQRQFKFIWDRAVTDVDKCKYRVLMRLFHAPAGLGNEGSILREVIMPSSKVVKHGSSNRLSYSISISGNRISIRQWDEIITAMVRLDYSDYEIYSFVRQVYDEKGFLGPDALPRVVFEHLSTGSSKDNQLLVKEKDAVLATREYSDGVAGGGDGDGSGGDDNQKMDPQPISEQECSDERSKYLMQQILSTVPNSFKCKSFASALDFGCAEGSITAVLGRALKIPVDKMFGADVREIPSPGFTFVLINTPTPSESPEASPVVDYSLSNSSPNPNPNPNPNLSKGRDIEVTSTELESTTILPSISSGSIDLVNASMVFHHIKTIKQSIAELRRIISPNGLLLIREHHCNSPEMGAFLDIVHGLYSLCWSFPIEWPNFVDEYEAYYRSQDEWNQLLLESGFQRVVPNYREEKDAHILYKKGSLPLKFFNASNPNIVNSIRAYHAAYVPISSSGGGGKPLSRSGGSGGIGGGGLKKTAGAWRTNAHSNADISTPRQSDFYDGKNISNTITTTTSSSISSAIATVIDTAASSPKSKSVSTGSWRHSANSAPSTSSTTDNNNSTNNKCNKDNRDNKDNKDNNNKYRSNNSTDNSNPRNLIANPRIISKSLHDSKSSNSNPNMAIAVTSASISTATEEPPKGGLSKSATTISSSVGVWRTASNSNNSSNNSNNASAITSTRTSTSTSTDNSQAQTPAQTPVQTPAPAPDAVSTTMAQIASSSSSVPSSSLNRNAKVFTPGLGPK